MNVVKKYNKEFKFLVTGGSSTLIDLFLYLLLSLKLDISISKMLSMIVACIYSYCINKKWTFSYKGKTNTVLIIKYVISQVLNITINTIVNRLVYNISGLKLVSFVIATAVAMIFNFLFQNYIVFKGDNK